MGKRFSVLVVTYNHESYISECVSGCLQQLGNDDEILINDDGSSDKTLEILKSFTDPRIRILQTDRLGTSAALNYLIQQATGHYISLISGDDRPTKTRLNDQLDFIERSPKHTFGVSRPRLIDEAGNILGSENYPNFFVGSSVDRYQLFRTLFFNGNFLCAPSWVGRREEIISLPPFEHLSLQMQDFGFWIKALALGIDIKISEIPWVDYRIPRQKSNLSSEKNYHRILFELELIYRKFFDLTNNEFMEKSFGSDLAGKFKTSAFNKELATAFLYLSHSNLIVQKLGLEQVFRLYDDIGYREELKANGISEQVFFKRGNQLEYEFLRLKDLLTLLRKKVDGRLEKIPLFWKSLLK